MDSSRKRPYHGDDGRAVRDGRSLGKKAKKDKKKKKKKKKKQKKKIVFQKKDRWASSSDEQPQSSSSSSASSDGDEGERRPVRGTTSSHVGAAAAATQHRTSNGPSESSEMQRLLEKIKDLRQTSLWHGCRSVDNYIKLNAIQEGSYGVVFRAKCAKTDDIVALKQVKLNQLAAKVGFPPTALREINVLLQMHHPNIIQVREMVVGSDTDKIFMVMEYMPHDLKMLMEAMTGIFFSQAEVKCLMKQLLSAINYMHSSFYLHRDLKTSNLLYGADGHLRVCDFGLARRFGEPVVPYTAEIITQWYRPPELLLGSKTYSAEVDMWSVGCIFAEILTKKVLFFTKTMSELAQLKAIFTLHGSPTEDRWPGYAKLPNVSRFQWKAKARSNLRSFVPEASFTGSPYLSAAGFELLSGLLDYNPEKRMAASDAFAHPYFEETPTAKDPSDMPQFPATTAGERKPKMESPKRVLRFD